MFKLIVKPTESVAKFKISLETINVGQWLWLSW